MNVAQLAELIDGLVVERCLWNGPVRLLVRDPCLPRIEIIRHHRLNAEIILRQVVLLERIGSEVVELRLIVLLRVQKVVVTEGHGAAVAKER